ncbi:MAG: Protein-L-isoaspartate(D-aspartate) O-methyltransferase [Actinomycetia bacterium]|nr:Protein-L-isoaspartate(D-aspartate) O-methyltransferase [Actinomycetes bacterium]
MIEVEEDQERDLRRALVAKLTEDGSLRDPRWIAAFQAVPRHVFVPRFLLDRTHTNTYEPVDATDPAQHREWLERVYSDEPLVTRVDGMFSVSSSSQPSLMADMLETLQITGAERVLEIGTGTGYNSALLCEGLGTDDQVFSVDIDADLVEAARGHLDGLGYRPTLATLDGAEGYPDGAPYDRIIATCSLPRVPVEWIAQTAEGGLILVNLYRDLGGGALALLRVEDGQASGHFMPYFGGFMPTCTIERIPGSELLATHRTHEDADRDGVERATAMSEDLLKDDTFGMVAALRVDAQRLGLLPEGEPEQFWLLGRDGSWAYQTTDKGGGLIAVQGGPIELWDQLEAAYDDWTALGRPAREEYGLTVTAGGEHIIWHGAPSGPSWRF